jgi:hypothetical protein
VFDQVGEAVGGDRVEFAEKGWCQWLRMISECAISGLERRGRGAIHVKQSKQSRDGRTEVKGVRGHATAYQLQLQQVESELSRSGRPKGAVLSLTRYPTFRESHRGETRRRGGRMRVIAPSQQLRCDFPVCSGTQLVKDADFHGRSGKW